MIIIGLMFAPFLVSRYSRVLEKSDKRNFPRFSLPSRVPTRRRLVGLNKITRDIPLIEMLSDVYGKINYTTSANVWHGYCIFVKEPRSKCSNYNRRHGRLVILLLGANPRMTILRLSRKKSLEYGVSIFFPDIFGYSV